MMKKDEFGRRLNHELANVRLSPEARARMARMAASQWPRSRRAFSPAVALAAALLLILCLSGGMLLMRRGETPDNTVAAPGATRTPAPTQADIGEEEPYPVALDELIQGMWITGDNRYFHLSQACAARIGVPSQADIHIYSDLQPCPKCLDRCVWLDMERNLFHLDMQCPGASNMAPIHVELISALGSEPCSACEAATFLDRFYMEDMEAIAAQETEQEQTSNGSISIMAGYEIIKALNEIVQELPESGE